MICADKVISDYGEDIVCGNEQFKGFISPIEPKNSEKRNYPLVTGIADNTEYLLIAKAELAEKAILSTHGKSYEVRRAEPIYFAGSVSHYEYVLRPKGGAGIV